MADDQEVPAETIRQVADLKYQCGQCKEEIHLEIHAVCDHDKKTVHSQRSERDDLVKCPHCTWVFSVPLYFIYRHRKN